MDGRPVIHPENRQSSLAGETLAGGGALVAAALAVVAWASCCVLPMALAGAGVAGVGGAVLLGMAAHRMLATVAATAVLGLGWLLWARTRHRCATGACAAPQTSSLVLLVGATALLGLAFIWSPVVEPFALRLIGALRG